MGEEISTEDAEKTLTAEELLKKIKSNQPEDLTSDNDFLGTISKGDMIKGFLESLLNRPVIKDKPDIQMIALYGEWGSGKTSLMQYVKSQLDEEHSFKTIFFPAWEMEKDDNLSLSLLEAIIESEKGLDKTDIKGALLAIGKGIGKGLSVKMGPININFKEVIQSVEDYNKSLTDDSSLKRINGFQEKYRQLENNILEKSKKEKLIVFIDDLDRCEPENVLDLLSVIKSFFKLGNRTIFICGLDKAAVDEAVKVKYKDIVKSGEYMEKIFDISFNMPRPNIDKMINYYFEALPETKDENKEVIKDVRGFFEAMHFTNPRHIKKVLNQYLMIRYYQESDIDDKGLIPDQKIDFFRYLTLFIIMLYKFESENFKTLRDYDEKLKHIKYSTDNGVALNYFDNLPACRANDYPEGSLKSIYSVGTVPMEIKAEEFLVKITTLFSSYIEKANVINMGNSNNFKEQKKKYVEQFSKDKSLGLPAHFCHYINMNPGILNNEIKNSPYRLWNIFDMAERYL